MGEREREIEGGDERRKKKRKGRGKNPPHISLLPPKTKKLRTPGPQPGARVRPRPLAPDRGLPRRAPRDRELGGRRVRVPVHSGGAPLDRQRHDHAPTAARGRPRHQALDLARARAEHEADALRGADPRAGVGHQGDPAAAVRDGQGGAVAQDDRAADGAVREFLLVFSELSLFSHFPGCW